MASISRDNKNIIPHPLLKNLSLIIQPILLKIIAVLKPLSWHSNQSSDLCHNYQLFSINFIGVSFRFKKGNLKLAGNPLDWILPFSGLPLIECGTSYLQSMKVRHIDMLFCLP